jgi:transmembrane sensor
MANLIERAIPGGLQQVGAERRLEDYIRAAAPQLQHDFLRDVFRSRAVAQDGIREADQVRVIGAEDGVEPLLDSLPKPFDVLLVAHAGVLTREGVETEYRGILCDGCHIRMSQEPTGMDWTVLARYLAGESSPEEAAAVRDWLARDPARGELIATLDRTTRLEPAAPPVDVEAALKRVKSRFNEPRVIPLASPRTRPPLVFLLAAGIMLLVGASLIWRTVRSTPAVSAPARDYATGIGELDSIPLADGSRVILGPASRLSVVAGYGDTFRALELEGEALFEVRHDASIPFTVRAGGAAIRDLGTTFTVRSDAEGVEVVVVEGSVLLQDTARAQRVLTLTAGRLGKLGSTQQPPLTRPAAPAEGEVSWAKRKLVFDNASLARVRDDLRRWYGLTLIVADSQLLTRHLKAEFSGETPQQVLDVIGLALGAVIERRGDTAVLRPRSPRTKAP